MLRKKRLLIAETAALVFVVALMGHFLFRERIHYGQIGKALQQMQAQTPEKEFKIMATPEAKGILQKRASVGEIYSVTGLYPAGEARRNGCDYLVTESPLEAGELEDAGYRLTLQKGNICLYESMMEPGQWKITQYGTVSGLQSMSYSLVSAEGDFILLDGGHGVDAPDRRRLIAEFGNQVDLWICSHFHVDHIGAITEILSAPGDITIKEIWCPPMDLETYKSFAKEWDCIDTCEIFLQEIADLKNVVRIHSGELKKVEDLEIFFLSAYDAEQPWTQEGNNCGFIFEVKAPKDKMLFCCDVGNDWISERLVLEYGDRLKADYVQMGHHGNGGLSEEAYRIVHPLAAFFDGPAWLFEDTERYTAAKNKELMENLGSRIFLMDEAPNHVILK